jgi:hypothetical protein
MYVDYLKCSRIYSMKNDDDDDMIIILFRKKVGLEGIG